MHQTANGDVLADMQVEIAATGGHLSGSLQSVTFCRAALFVPIRNGFLSLGDSSGWFRSTRCQQTPAQTAPPSLPFRLPSELEGDPLYCEMRLHLWPLGALPLLAHLPSASHQMKLDRSVRSVRPPAPSTSFRRTKLP